MRVQTFVGKVGMDSLRQMDQQINHWLKQNNVEPKFVTQTFGYEPHREVNNNEPVIVTSIWYISGDSTSRDWTEKSMLA